MLIDLDPTTAQLQNSPEEIVRVDLRDPNKINELSLLILELADQQWIMQLWQLVNNSLAFSIESDPEWQKPDLTQLQDFIAKLLTSEIATSWLNEWRNQFGIKLLQLRLGQMAEDGIKAV